MLLVAADRDRRAEMRAVLESGGFKVHTPPRPSLALSRLKYVDGVCVDLSDDDPGCRDLCREIRLRDTCLPLLLLLPSSGEQCLTSAEELGADDFVAYPCAPDEVAARLRTRIRIRAREREAASMAAKHRALVDSAQAGLYVVQDGRFTYVNQQFARLFGYAVHEIDPFTTIHDLVAEDERLAVGTRFAQWMEGDEPSFRCSFRGERKGGRTVHVELHGTRVRIADRPAFIGTVLDVSRRKQAQEAQQRGQEYFRVLIERAQDIITVVDQDGVVLYESPSVQSVLGYPSDELLGQNIFDLIHRDDAPHARAVMARMRQTPGLVLSTRCRFRNQQGEWRVLEATGRDLLDHPTIQGFVINSRDVTEQQMAEDALRQSEERFRLLVEGGEQAFFYIYDRERRAEYLSPSVEAVLGYRPDELLRQPFDRLLPEDGTEAAFSEVTEDMLRSGWRPTAYRTRAKHRDGRVVTLERVEGPVLRGGEIVGIQGFARDVSDSERMEIALRQAAFTDALTGLPNRALFADRLAQSDARARRQPDSRCAVLFLDLDRFKVVNDSLGHAVGDQLLVAVARRLRAHLRPEDTVARFGGDEFAILLEDVQGPQDCTRVAQRVLTAMAAPFDLDGYEVFTSASIGIVLGAADCDGIDHLLRNADVAMYRAKASGGAGYEIFDRAMHTEVVHRLQVETDLRYALDRGEFSLRYQPIVNLASGRVAGFEALIRWEHPERGTIAPLEFIGIAEETGRIVEIGGWVIDTACRQVREWQDRVANPDLFVAVNLSSRQLHHPDLAARVAAALRDAGIAGRSLKLEITESMVVANTEQVAWALKQLKGLGVQLYMDDFGTGYASLSLLHRLPIDGLKIDRSFVSPMHEDPRNAVLVESTVALAQGLALKVVAEGVELAAHAGRLRELHCDFAQGYLFAHPLDAALAGGFLDRTFGTPAAAARMASRA